MESQSPWPSPFNVQSGGALKRNQSHSCNRKYSSCLLQVEEGVKLGRGDAVSMVVTFNAQSGERNGQRVKRLKEAEKDAKKPEFVAERNPNAVRYIGNKVVGCPSSCWP